MISVMDATVIHFRTSLTGFNKKDVTEYISRTATSFRESMAKLNDDILRLERENEELRNSSANTAYIQQLEDEASSCADARAENARLQARIRELEALLAQTQDKLTLTEDKLAQAEASLAETPAQVAELVMEPVPDQKELELEAYRRAEEMMRRVSLGATALNSQFTQISLETSESFRQAVDTAKQAISVMESQLAVIHSVTRSIDNSMTESLEKIHAAAGVLYAPAAEELI